MVEGSDFCGGGVILSYNYVCDYVCEGRLDCGQYSPSGVYMEGLVFVDVWSGVDFLVVDFDEDHPYVYDLTHGREVVDVRRFNEIVRQEGRYPNPAGRYSARSTPVLSGVRRLVGGTPGVELVSDLGLVVREYLPLPASVPYLLQLPAGREVVYVRTVEGWRSFRWGGCFYRPVAGQMAADVLDVAWEQVFGRRFEGV